MNHTKPVLSAFLISHRRTAEKIAMSFCRNRFALRKKIIEYKTERERALKRMHMPQKAINSNSNIMWFFEIVSHIPLVYHFSFSIV
jgi:hypothetical protein